jgi:hypothetical protein
MDLALHSVEMHRMDMYDLTSGEPDITMEPNVAESCLELKLRVTGPPPSISELSSALKVTSPGDPALIGRLATALGVSSSVASEVASLHAKLEDLEGQVKRLRSGRA